MLHKRQSTEFGCDTASFQMIRMKMHLLKKGKKILIPICKLVFILK